MAPIFADGSFNRSASRFKANCRTQLSASPGNVSFRKDPDGILNVLVRADGGGDAMWRPEVSAGDIALLRVPVSAFGNGSREAATGRGKMPT